MGDSQHTNSDIPHPSTTPATASVPVELLATNTIVSPGTTSVSSQPVLKSQTITNKQPAPKTPTKPGNISVYLSGLAITTLLIIALIFINDAGLQTTTYGDASSYSSYASLVSWLLAAIIGVLMAYRLLHPRKTKQYTSIRRYVIVALGFFLGLVPGIILAFVITYPLSQHACQLSGSKYC